MTNQTYQQIKITAKRVFATTGYDGLAMRTLAQESGVGLSSIYHFFEDKDVLLYEIFQATNTNLGVERAALPSRKSAKQQLKDIIGFQFKHIEDVVFVFKYYLHYRPQFEHQKRGYVPSKAYLHIEEVIRHGIKTGEFNIAEADIAKESKIVTHAINGFLLEYYPDPPKGRELSEVASSLHSFIVRALTTERRIM